MPQRFQFYPASKTEILKYKTYTQIDLLSSPRFSTWKQHKKSPVQPLSSPLKINERLK